MYSEEQNSPALSDVDYLIEQAAEQTLKSYAHLIELLILRLEYELNVINATLNQEN